MNENDALLKRIEAYCARHGIAESTFGFRSVNDGKLVARLRAGNTITMRTVRQIEDALKRRAAA